MIVSSAIFILAVGLALAQRFEVEWLRIAVLVGAPLAVAITISTIKTREKAKSRSMAPGSIEAAVDETARAGSFVDAIITTAAALALSAIVDGIATWGACAALLAIFAISYWVRRLLAGRSLRHASSQ
ncbi:hypothetical protein [Rhodoglobus vestalii]|uniref:hypothetical protein n=1 Tax=Rhodoglobus vestalii TaxID=193384 RepID=UPI0014769E6B|nr:hypothetical protein [Rhodoglobus vestalii]